MAFKTLTNSGLNQLKLATYLGAKTITYIKKCLAIELMFHHAMYYIMKIARKSSDVTALALQLQSCDDMMRYVTS